MNTMLNPSDDRALDAARALTDVPMLGHLRQYSYESPREFRARKQRAANRELASAEQMIRGCWKDFRNARRWLSAYGCTGSIYPDEVASASLETLDSARDGLKEAFAKRRQLLGRDREALRIARGSGV